MKFINTITETLGIDYVGATFRLYYQAVALLSWWSSKYD